MASIDKKPESKSMNPSPGKEKNLNSADASAELLINRDQIYKTIRTQIVSAKHQIYSSVNASMLAVYWNTGKEIYMACGENDRAAYGKQILQYISERLTAEFGKGFSIRNLRNMRRFYLTFPDLQSLHSQLSWSHYLLLMNVEDARIRAFYLDEAVKSGWSVRQLERQINTMFYQRLLASRDKESVSKETVRFSFVSIFFF